MKNNNERIVLILLVVISVVLSATSLLMTLSRNDEKLVTIGKDNLEMTMLYQESGQVVIGTYPAHVQFLADSIILRGDKTYFESQIYSNGERALSENVVCGKVVLKFQNGILVGK